MSNPIVQVAHATGSTGTTPVTLPSSVTAGNALLIGISHAGAASVTFTSVVDSQSNSIVTLSAYTEVRPQGAGYNGIGWYLIQSATAGTHTITANTSAVSCTIYAAELSSSILGGTLSLDVTSAVASGGTANVLTNSLTPTTGDLLLAMANNQSTATYGAWSNGFTQADSQSSGAWSYLFPSSNVSINTGSTLSAAAGWAAQLVALKVSGGGAVAAPESSGSAIRMSGSAVRIGMAPLMMMPLGWIIERRRRLARKPGAEFVQDEKTGLMLPRDPK